MFDRRKKKLAGLDLPSLGKIVNRPHFQAHFLMRTHFQETPQPRPTTLHHPPELTFQPTRPLHRRLRPRLSPKRTP